MQFQRLKSDIVDDVLKHEIGILSVFFVFLINDLELVNEICDLSGLPLLFQLHLFLFFLLALALPLVLLKHLLILLDCVFLLELHLPFLVLELLPLAFNFRHLLLLSLHLLFKETSELLFLASEILLLLILDRVEPEDRFHGGFGLLLGPSYSLLLCTLLQCSLSRFFLLLALQLLLLLSTQLKLSQGLLVV